MTIIFNDEYLNRTVNKAPRRAALVAAPGFGYLGTLLHETAGNRSDPRNTLNWNLTEYDAHGNLVQSSYDFLIDQWGVIWRYVDIERFTSYHAGRSVWTHNGVTYRNYAVNERLVSVEVDGPNNGTPALPAQIDAFGRLIVWLEANYGIPPTVATYPYHYEVAPTRKTDPRGYSRAQIFAAALQFKDHIPDPGLEVVYLTTTVAARVRTEPSRHGETVMIMPADTTAGYDGDTIGESIGGNDIWKHRADQLGFVHSSLLEEAA